MKSGMTTRMGLCPSSHYQITRNEKVRLPSGTCMHYICLRSERHGQHRAVGLGDDAVRDVFGDMRSQQRRLAHAKNDHLCLLLAGIVHHSVGDLAAEGGRADRRGDDHAALSRELLERLGHDGGHDLALRTGFERTWQDVKAMER